MNNLKKKEQEKLKLKEEEGVSKFEKFKLKEQEQEKLKSKENLISKLESFEVDNNKKN